MKINESGRSMIEMLGVLAIIGVLSVGGIAGYSKAMAKFRINKTIDQVSHIVANTRILFGAQKTYVDLGTCTASGGTEDGKTLIKSAKLMPDGMSDDTKENNKEVTYFSNAYAGRLHFCASGRLSSADNKSFTLAFTGIPQDACIDLATQDWSAASGSGLVAIEVNGVSGNNAAIDISDMVTFSQLTATGCLSTTNADSKAYVCGSGTKAEPMKIIDATKACSGDFNTIYFKFY
ncbi:MAG: hypothetical protein IJ770_01030 [Alphaproteobacteria bacterium]|nr:hypothetical protein [Alphaproteobacteria bacterium]